VFTAASRETVVQTGSGLRKPGLAAWILTVAVLSGLTACGGGGGGSSVASQAPPAAQPPAPAPNPAPPPPQTVPGSSLLKDNAPGENGRYDNFVSERVTVPVDRHAFSGRHVFVKVAVPDGQVLFLGEVAPALPFSLSVQVQVGTPRLGYEIFSESGLDQIVFGEIAL